MKRIDTSHIVLGVGYPPAKKGYDFLQDSYKEAIAMLVQNSIGTEAVDNTVPYALYGCRKTGAGPYAYSAGAIFFNGEIYALDAIASLAIATKDICTITATADPTADPTTMTDGSSINIHDVRKITISDGTAGTTDFDFDEIVYLYSWNSLALTDSDLSSTGGGNWNLGTGAAGFYYKKIGKTVHFQLICLNTENNGSNIATGFTAIIPSLTDLEPGTAQYASGIYINTTSPNVDDANGLGTCPAIVTLTNSGNLLALNLSPAITNATAVGFNTLDPNSCTIRVSGTYFTV